MAVSRIKKLPLLSGSRLLACILTVQVALTAATLARLETSADPGHGAALVVYASGAVLLVAFWTGVWATHSQRRKQPTASTLSHLTEAVLDHSRVWVWALDGNGRFTYSSPASAALVGYDPLELIGRHISLVLPEVAAWGGLPCTLVATHRGKTWADAVLTYRHRSGADVVLAASGRNRPDRHPRGLAMEGISRPGPYSQHADTAATGPGPQIENRINDILRNGLILTAFQPIRDLSSGSITGVEALTRFPSDDGRSPEPWFSHAAAVGLGSDLEFAALETALHKAAALPAHLSVAVNLSPKTCLDPRLPALLERSGFPSGRIVIEITERLPVSDYVPLERALRPLRACGMRLAVDDAGSGFASMRHILRLKPDIIKLDRSLISGIDTDPGQMALGAALLKFAQHTGARLLAEGIETPSELATLTRLGITAGQGYLLGRPTIDPADWAAWSTPAREHDTL
ncbi:MULTISPECIES: EAL domain-containing protein [unclassified Arthrobacter]|uniref:EAL domain-containing protein n=1 Tax=unclassified Arthrobacter TaxID=235627 RepID=UPI001C85CAE7|nr:EAL domain-containing protein [Arthrobacter sp. MAHUQ-56]MBX7443358.1 EAL domain-containing protein [Arthrobacter sp. MAHUQ-56]